MAHPRSSRRVGRYRSQLEADVAGDLDARGVTYEYETVEICYETPQIYLPDFQLENGVIVEAKGYFPPEDRRKMMEVRRANPDLVIGIVFQDPAKKISRRPAALTYGQWAERAGFLVAKAYVPDAWIKRRPK